MGYAGRHTSTGLQLLGGSAEISQAYPTPKVKRAELWKEVQRLKEQGFPQENGFRIEF